MLQRVQEIFSHHFLLSSWAFWGIFFCFLHLPRYALLFLQLEAGAPHPDVLHCCAASAEKRTKALEQSEHKEMGWEQGLDPHHLWVCVLVVYTLNA